MFVVQHHYFGFKKPKFKNTNLWSKGGLQHNGLFLSNCVLQNVKSYRFWVGLFWGKFLVAFQKHYKNRHFGTFFKAKNYKKK